MPLRAVHPGHDWIAPLHDCYGSVGAGIVTHTRPIAADRGDLQG